MRRNLRWNICLLALLVLMPAGAVRAADRGFTHDYEPPDPDKLDPVYSLDPLPLRLDVAEQTVEAANERAEKLRGQEAITALLRNTGKATLEILQAMENQARFPLTVYADTMDALGETVDVRITFRPVHAVQDMNLHGNTLSSAVQGMRSYLERRLETNLQVLYLGQEGSYGIWVEVAAAVDLSALGDTLYFYSWQEEPERMREISTPSWWVDDSGYLHFYTWLGDYIVISDRPLQ